MKCCSDHVHQLAAALLQLCWQPQGVWVGREERREERGHGDIRPPRPAPAVAAHNFLVQRSAQSPLQPLSQPGLKVDLCLVYSLRELGAELPVYFRILSVKHSRSK